MKRTAWRIVTISFIVVLIAAACLVGVAAYRGISFSEAVYIETDHGNMLLIEGSPISMSSGDSLFDGLTDGDKVFVVHGPIAESYPGQAKAYLCIKQPGDEKGDIPDDVIRSLQELGWLSWFCP